LVGRVLVTTANKITWPKDNSEPVLFLGEWCRLYKRKSEWEGLDAIVEPYHWNDRKKLHTDYLYLLELYEEILLDLTSQLNKIHSVNHSVRYWRILIGPWLGYFVQILFDRWSMLKQVIEKQDVTECNIVNRSFYNCIPCDMENFSEIIEKDDWNEAIYTQLLKYCWSDSILLKNVDLHPKKISRIVNIQKSRKSGWRFRVSRLINYFNRLLPNNNKYFMTSTYLPLKIELILQMSLRQFPRVWRKEGIPCVQPDKQQREWDLFQPGVSISPDSFEKVARKMISLHMPTAYLEGYETIIKKVKISLLSFQPKMIFTSNAYETDDIFKFFSAENTELGSRLVIGQHGGNFGMSPFGFSEYHQIKISDKWLSWGRDDLSESKITPTGMISHYSQDAKYNSMGNLLMIEMAVPRYSTHLYCIPIASQQIDYFNEQKLFLESLPSIIREQVLLRLYSKDYDWNMAERWSDEMPEIKLDLGHQNIKSLIGESRLYISTYNATSYLESLSSNIPTIVFWKPEHWELKEEVKPYFDLLKNVGIFHKTPESASKQTAMVWNDVDAWWKSSDVQEARLKFCQKFANNSKELQIELKNIFIDLSKDER
jgi:putative transferase (TIGR04331 family)